MASIEFDPIVKRISRSMGNFVYSTWKGKPIIKRKPKRTAAFTDSQRNVQKTFKITVMTWKAIPDLFKQSFKHGTMGKAITESNLFISINSKRQRSGEPYQLTQNSGVNRLTGYSATSDSYGNLKVSFDAEDEVGQSVLPVNLTVVLHKIENGVASPNIKILKDIYDGSSADINGLESGEYFLYCITTDKRFDEAKAVSESTAIRVKII